MRLPPAIAGVEAGRRETPAGKRPRHPIVILDRDAGRQDTGQNAHSGCASCQENPPHDSPEPDTYLPREKVPGALEKELGLRTTKASLATMAVRGGGPKFRKFGPRAVYRWGDVVAWAEAKLSVPRSSTSEGYALDRAAHGKNEPMRETGAKASRRRRKTHPLAEPHQTAAE